ncbi:MAG: glycosyltransferase family 4 protein [Flavobacteriales bacterium]|nr:glycosyltransferase family 4 protein [Flavobacteriales bacterium]MBP7154684.1 glycosyltransferase family 4 protein [Flavobacteriales bacterium]HQW39744.1 glycosyltransferase family 4 protein [Flavobacteriales bacterium]
MRILQLCNKPPYPPIDGGSKAMHNLTRGLVDAGHLVKVLCISTPKNDLKLDELPAEYRERTNIESVFVDTSLNVVDAFTDLITADNYNISRFFSPDMDIRLIRLLTEQKFDIIQLESLFMTPYIPTVRRYTNAPIILRSHNLEHVIQDRIASGERNFLKRPYRKFLAKQLHTYEMEMLDRVDGVVAISPLDAEHFLEHGTRTPVITIPFGVEPSEYEPDDRVRSGPPVFFHLGSMDWLPNEEGIRWLLDTVWPKVLLKRPNAKLHLAGNKMPADLLEHEQKGVTIKGRVKSALDYMRSKQVMVVPLFSAGGMRVKIIEGMALGKVVIATPIGAEGIDYTEGSDILIARNANEFAEHIIALDGTPDYTRMIGENARKLVMTKYSDSNLVKDLVAFYERVRKK